VDEGLSDFVDCAPFLKNKLDCDLLKLEGMDQEFAVLTDRGGMSIRSNDYRKSKCL